MNKQQLKNSVRDYWNKASCGTEFIQEPKLSSEYFCAIEQFRYSIEPEIFAFAQFTRFRTKKVLEVGVGAGTDFIQWVRAGAYAYGIDLTQESINNVTQRLALENLQAADLLVADAEQLPYEDNFFDLVYSWGVIHHSPDTQQCLQEIIRVTKAGGTIKIMIYNRHSLFALYRYSVAALCKGTPFRSFAHVLWHDQESPGTKAYTKKEVLQWFKTLPVTIVTLQSPVTNHDLLYYKSSSWRWIARTAAAVLGWQRCGWFMMIELKKH